MMTLVERYIFRTGLGAFLAALGALTAVIWVTQALRQFDLMATKGQSFLIFISVTGLIIPSLVMTIAPIALLLAVVYTLNKLNADSELIVMAAAGMAPGALLRPLLCLSLLVALTIGAVSLVVMPWSFVTLRTMLTSVNADFLTRVVREGSFTALDKQGFFFHYRERGPNGELLGIFMQDRRDVDQVSTYLAELGQTLQVGRDTFLVLEKGSVQRQRKAARDPAIIVFDRYQIDLAQFGKDGQTAPLQPRERSTAGLIAPPSEDAYARANRGLIAQELHERIVNPLYAVALGLIGVAALARARTTRQERGGALGAAVAAAMLTRGLGFYASALVAHQPLAIPLVYAIPLGACVVSLGVILAPGFFARAPVLAPA